MAEYLAKHGAMTEDQVAEVVLDVLRALCRAQEMGLKLGVRVWGCNVGT